MSSVRAARSSLLPLAHFGLHASIGSLTNHWSPAAVPCLGQVKTLVASVDNDGNGEVDFNEFKIICKSKAE